MSATPVSCRSSLLAFSVGMVAALATGCGDMQFGRPKRIKQVVKQDPVQSRAIEKQKKQKKSGSTTTSKAPKTNRGGTTSSKVGSDATDRLTATVGDLIRQSVETSPTLVVWLVDRSESAETLVDRVASAAEQAYRDERTVQALAAEPDRLLTAVGAYAREVEWIQEEPAAKIEGLREMFAKSPAAGGRENTFASIAKAAETIQGWSARKGRDVLLCVVTDEVGDDVEQLEAAVAAAKKAKAQVFVLGPPAPFGVANPMMRFAGNSAGKQDGDPRHGPETLFPEIVLQGFWNSGYGSGDMLMVIDSGFGPWGLERLCRATDGRYLATRSDDAVGGFTGGQWPTASAQRFESDAMAKYSPDYDLTYDEYVKSIDDNKAKRALVDAAKLPRADVLSSPQTRFVMGNEAQNKTMLDKAQQAAAKLEPVADKIHGALVAGESDRAKLDSPRWKAAYDLALGRACASKARIDGYNAMLAALKRGKTFSKEGSRAWVLTPSESVETGSAIKNLADKGRKLLEGVVTDHPGTPWAMMADEELKTDLGWTWNEE